MTDKIQLTAASSPPLPLKTRIYTAVIGAVTDTASRADGTVNRRLLRLLDPPTRASAKPAGGARTADVTVDPSRGLWFRLFVPVAATADPSGGRLPVVVFFHGGGFVFLSAASRSYDAVCRRICRKTRALVVSVNYRLAPEHRHPACYKDGEDVLRFLDAGGLDAADKAAADMADLSSCFLVGDSAGGNIAHQVVRRWAAGEGAGDWKRVRVAGLVAIQPFFGGEERTEAELRLRRSLIVTLERTDWCWRAFLPEGESKDHEAANVFGPRAGAELEAAFPPALVVVAGFDPLQERQRSYYEGLRARGKEARLVDYPNTIHAFYIFPELKEAAELIEEMRAFMEKYASK